MTDQTLDLAESPNEEPPDPDEPGTAQVFAHWAVTAGLVAAAVTLGVWALLADAYPTSPQPIVDLPDAPFAAAEYRGSVDRLQHALAVYHLARDSFPSSLDELVAAELVRADDLLYASGRERFDYARHPDGYTLRPASRSDGD